MTAINASLRKSHAVYPVCFVEECWIIVILGASMPMTREEKARFNHMVSEPDAQAVRIARSSRRELLQMLAKRKLHLSHEAQMKRPLQKQCLENEHCWIFEEAACENIARPNVRCLAKTQMTELQGCSKGDSSQMSLDCTPHHICIEEDRRHMATPSAAQPLEKNCRFTHTQCTPD